MKKAQLIIAIFNFIVGVYCLFAAITSLRAGDFFHGSVILIFALGNFLFAFLNKYLSKRNKK